MKSFKLTGEVTISVYTTVEADSLEQAVDIATSRDIERGTWNDKNQDKYAWISDEYDGEVFNIEES